MGIGFAAALLVFWGLLWVAAALFGAHAGDGALDLGAAVGFGIGLAELGVVTADPASADLRHLVELALIVKPQKRLASPAGRFLLERTARRCVYSLCMTQRMGAKGQVVIPKDLRERAGLGPGADVDFEPREDGIVVRRADSRSSLRGRFSGSGMAARLLEDRKREPR